MNFCWERVLGTIFYSKKKEDYACFDFLEIENHFIFPSPRGNKVSGRCKEIKANINPMEKSKNFLVSVCKTLWEVGRDKPRRVVHALKVGLALTLVSLLYLWEPLYENFGQNAMWAVMTVVVVLEYTGGATLCKGLNRGCGTLSAGLLAFAIEELAEQSGKVFRAVFIGGSVFLVGFMATYLRFVPCIKKNYDYGVMIFLLTFNLISVSSFRVHDVVGLARDRFFTIIIGCTVCLVMSLLILPNWSGDDLHNATVKKLDGLSRAIETSVNEYFEDRHTKVIQDEATDDPICKDYREVLDYKSIDETLAVFASWEPRCTRNCNKYPWKQYVKLGTALRHFGYTAVALHGCLHSQIQAPPSVRMLFRDPCTQVAKEVSKVLSELASNIKNYQHFSPDMLTEHLREALQDLNCAIKSKPRLFQGNNTIKEAKIDHPDNDASSGVICSPVKSNISALLNQRSIKVEDQSKNSLGQKQLRPALSKIAMTSLEFSEALPFAGFVSLLVEMVAKLDLVIEEVEELARAARFKKFSGRNDIAIDVSRKEKDCTDNDAELQNYNVAMQAGE